jgi:hypothetical protein
MKIWRAIADADHRQGVAYELRSVIRSEHLPTCMGSDNKERRRLNLQIVLAPDFPLQFDAVVKFF